MIATLIACDHAEARDPRLLGSRTAAPATRVPGRRGPPPSLFRNPAGHLAGPGPDTDGKCADALSSAAQAAVFSEEGDR